MLRLVAAFLGFEREKARSESGNKLPHSKNKLPLLPGNAGGIPIPTNVTGPGQVTWSVTNPDDGQFQLKVDGGATFQAGDTLSFTLQNVVIREGGDGTALVPVREASGAGRGETEVGIGITESTLDVQLSVPADQTSIEPNQPVTLTWTTTDAKSGTLNLPGNIPETKPLDPSSNLVSGQLTVTPIENTTYSLTCEGRGPDVMRQVTVSLLEVQAPKFSSSVDAFDASQTITLSWQTEYATSCAISTVEGEGSVNVPVANDSTASCNVAATADGTTLILTTAEGTNQELGRLTLPVPSPLSVTFILTANGSPMSKQQTYDVALVPVEIEMWMGRGGDAGGQWNEQTQSMVYEAFALWTVNHAGSVVMAVNGNPMSTSPDGNWTANNLESPASPSLICQGFGGPLTGTTGNDIGTTGNDLS